MHVKYLKPIWLISLWQWKLLVFLAIIFIVITFSLNTINRLDSEGQVILCLLFIASLSDYHAKFTWFTTTFYYFYFSLHFLLNASFKNIKVHTPWKRSVDDLLKISRLGSYWVILMGNYYNLVYRLIYNRIFNWICLNSK